jgi:dTDP-4-amino-4,6-dideoxygalactose transaminase
VSTLIFPGLPRASYLAQREEIEGAIRSVLDSECHILGSEVSAFESEFARYLGAAHAVGVANGTDAIELALRACELGRGAQVITVSHTAVATVAAIERAGAEPVLVDIDPATFTMGIENLERTLQAATPERKRAILPVHLYGRPAAMAEILALAEQYGARVIEDGAQAHGAALGERKVGTFGHLAAFSFYPTKNLGAIGDGGAIVTADTELAARIRELRQYGWRERYISAVPGVNSRLDELQAAILRVKLRRLDADNARRRAWARYYDTALADLPLVRPADPVAGACRHVYHLYVVRSSVRDDLLAHLHQAGIPAQIHYPQPVHLQPAYRGRVVIGCGGLAETERACKEVLTLPLHPHLNESHLERVVDTMRRWFARRTG